MLQFKAVTKSFKDGNQTIEAVKSTDLSFNQGELIAIIVGHLVLGKALFNNGRRITNTYYG